MEQKAPEPLLALHPSSGLQRRREYLSWKLVRLRLFREFAPESAAVEEVFHAVNTRTALKLAHVRGVALLSIAEAGVALAEYSPLEVKISVVGYGRAEKCQVQMMVRSLLHLPAAIESEDACDALAVAICHATHQASRRLA